MAISPSVQSPAETKPEAQPRAPGADPGYPSPGYSWYVVIVLTIIYIFSFMDRQIMNLMVAPIRRDFQISDTQVSLLMGFAFALFYTVFGLPLGRMADSMNRVGLIAAGLTLWSLMTAACGMARNFWQLALTRFGVGIGEASLSPSAYSLITDYFPKNRLATAISVYSMGIYIGGGLATIIPGLFLDQLQRVADYDVPILGHVRSWQLIFILVGLPGVFLALLLFTVREPFRRGVRRLKALDGSSKIVQASVREVAAYIGKNWVTIGCHNLGFALLSFSSYGCTAWIPAFLVRNHGYTWGRAGIVYGAIIATAGTLGVVAGGRLADWLADRGYRDSKMRAGLIAGVIWLPTGLFYSIVSNANLAVLLMVPTVFAACMPFGAAPAAIQEMMPNPMRAQASAVYLFVVNLLGLGLGPTAVAAATDHIFKDDNAVRYSLLLVAASAHLVASLLLWVGMKHFRKSMDRLEEWTAANA